MKCPICSNAQLIHDTRDMPYTYKGEETVLPGIEGDYCPACGEVILDRANSMKAGALMREFNKQVNAATVDPGFIVSVRKKLALDQKEAAEIFGGGVNAFSRYENGKLVLHSPWSSCSKFWSVTPTCSPKSAKPQPPGTAEHQALP